MIIPRIFLQLTQMLFFISNSAGWSLQYESVKITPKFDKCLTKNIIFLYDRCLIFTTEDYSDLWIDKHISLTKAVFVGGWSVEFELRPSGYLKTFH